MVDVFFKRLGLLQGVLIGIYGNWLISFFDKFGLVEETAWWTILLLFAALATFLLFFASCWLSSRSKRVTLSFGALHIISVILITVLELETRPVSLWFVLIGQVVFWLLAAFVVTTSEYEERFVK